MRDLIPFSKTSCLYIEDNRQLATLLGFLSISVIRKIIQITELLMIIRYTDDTKTTFMTPCIFIFTFEKKIRKKDEKKRSEERTKKISNPFLIIFILDSFLLFLFPPHLPCFFFPRSLIFAYLKKVPWKEDI